MSRIFSLVFASVVFSAAACSVPVSGAAQSADEVRASTPAEKGEACGSDVAIQRSCADGLTCVLPDGGPISEHTAGVCLPAAGEGEACGRDVIIAKWCTEGLTCVFPAGGPITEHRVGTCMKAAPVNAHHYEPTVQNVTWAPGCGIQPPNGGRCDLGIELTYTKQYIDLETTTSEELDRDAGKVTITLDTWSTKRVHSRVAVRPGTVNLGIPNGLPLNGAIDVVVVDFEGKELFEGSITPGFAP
jgi:hypothetical protein